MSTLQRLIRGETRVDFIGKRRLWFAISGVLIVLSIGSILLKQTESPCASFLKGLDCGIEFVGGLQLRAVVAEDGPLADADNLDVISEVRDAVSEAGIAGAQVQVATQQGNREILVQTRSVEPEARETVSDAVAQAVGSEISDTSQIAASWGQQITNRAMRALLVFFAVIFIFISWRFEWKMAIAAMSAMLHDLIITAGIYSLIGFEVTPSTVIALLTILGYSLYDTVVVFDRVEEDTTLYAATGRMTYKDAANLAVNEVFMRSLNTSLATLLPVGALLFVGAGLFGANTLKDLALALFVGLLVSAYSSVFTATPLLSMLKEREPRFRASEERLQRAARARTGEVATAEAGAGDAGVVPTTATASAQRPSPKARAGDKKAKRRKRR